jgi:hypothetical protein
MKSENKSICFIVMCVFSWCLFAGESIKIPSKGSFVLDGIVNGENINISLCVRSLGNGGDCCNDVLEPSALIGIYCLRITVNGQSIFVPRSLYSDVLNPREMHLLRYKNNFKLVIVGGDGSDTYNVDILFGKTRVLSRAVYSYLVPGRPTEKTTYWNRVLD